MPKPQRWASHDAFGHRTMQYAPPVYNEYVVDLSGRAITAIKPGTVVYTAEVFAGGRHWTTDNGNALFLGSDWVGNTRALTNLISGSFDQLYTSSSPWGDGLSYTGGSNLHTTSQFTGKEYDAESNLYHFPFRQYAPVQGRWLTPDPAGLAAVDPTNPQTWNRYAYVNNNPVSSVDPLGLTNCPECRFLGAGGSGAYCGMDGVNTPCSAVIGALGPSFPGDGSLGGAVQCPNNNCGIGTSTPFQCVGSVCGYMSNQYVATHEYEWGGVLYSADQWQTFLSDRVDAQRQALADAISYASASPDGSNWDSIYASLQYVDDGTEGGNANFKWTGDLGLISFIPGYLAGGCEVMCRFGGVPSIHMPGDYILHLDSGNPLWGFGLGAFVHGVVDVLLGNINPSVPRGPW